MGSPVSALRVAFSLCALAAATSCKDDPVKSGGDFDAPCGSGDTCNPGLSCVDDRCALLCSTSEDCPGDRACEGALCTLVPGATCREHGQCSSPGACDEPGSAGRCVAGQCVYAARAELCNGVDDDCDGQIDEDFGNSGTVVFDGGPYAPDAGGTLGESCGIGACGGGIVVCADTSSLTCDSLDQMAADLCDLVDNDCDGELDEDFVPGPCTSGEHGICSAGMSTCGAAGLGCVSTTPPTTEIACNGLDDDCDGQVDEGSLGIDCAAPTCSAIQAAWDAPNGVYLIATPSADASCASMPERQLYCDMTGGGWTLVFWHDGGHCQPIGPAPGWGDRWFLADCNGWHPESELQVDPVARANTAFAGNRPVVTWIDIRTMAWTQLRIAGYHDPEVGGSSPIAVSSSNPIPRGELATPFGTSGYYLNGSATDGYYWCGGADAFECKGRTTLEGGWDFSTSLQPNRWLTIDSDTSGEPSCPSNTVSTCQQSGVAACWCPSLNTFGGQAVWVR